MYVRSWVRINAWSLFGCDRYCGEDHPTPRSLHMLHRARSCKCPHLLHACLLSCTNACQVVCLDIMANPDHLVCYTQVRHTRTSLCLPLFGNMPECIYGARIYSYPSYQPFFRDFRVSSGNIIDSLEVLIQYSHAAGVRNHTKQHCMGLSTAVELQLVARTVYIVSIYQVYSTSVDLNRSSMNYIRHTYWYPGMLYHIPPL